MKKKTTSVISLVNFLKTKDEQKKILNNFKTNIIQKNTIQMVIDFSSKIFKYSKICVLVIQCNSMLAYHQPKNTGGTHVHKNQAFNRIIRNFFFSPILQNRSNNQLHLSGWTET